MALAACWLVAATFSVAVRPFAGVPHAPQPAGAGPSAAALVDPGLEHYRDRREYYLNESVRGNSRWCQVAKAYRGLAVDEDVVRGSFERVLERGDGADFRLNFLLRLVHVGEATGALSGQFREEVDGVLLGAKYWFTEPGADSAIFWTENHQVLYHAAELLAGQRFYHRTFPPSGLTGRQHYEHALPLVRSWLSFRARFGFAEWHSNAYAPWDLVALLNLVDFAWDGDVAARAAMLVDVVALNFANHYFDGTYATTHGRAYDESVAGRRPGEAARRDGTSEAAWLLLGVGQHDENDVGDAAAVCLATSDRYEVPGVLEALARDLEAPAGTGTGKGTGLPVEIRERDGFDVGDGPAWGLGYEDEADVVAWWGMAAPLAPPVVAGTFALQDAHGVSSEVLYGPPLLRTILEWGASLRGWTLAEYSARVSAVTRGVALEAANVYTYRARHYQLSGVQNHKPGYNSFQQHAWQATLDRDARVFTSSPSGVCKPPGEWTGGWNPRVTLFRNVGVVQYDRPALPLELELVLFLTGFGSSGHRETYLHAYFPRWAFDEVRTVGRWTFGAKGGGFVALYSAERAWWENDHELRVAGKRNAWIVELGSTDEWEGFDAFVAAVSRARVDVSRTKVGYDVLYESPSAGLVVSTWGGPFRVNGTVVDLGPYERFDAPHARQEFGGNATVVTHGGSALRLDFGTGTRTEEAATAGVARR
ncbi:MAG: hypothetical protein Kow0069_20640 [Promethearchaeota archaeon]